MSSTPLVSICINNYNYERFVGRAIQSALTQGGARTEVVVVDDGSTDRSRDVIARFGDQITIVAKANGGHASALNAGFAASRGDLVVFLDADDELEPTCCTRLVAAADGHAKLHWRLRLVDADGRPFGVNPSWGTELASGDVVADVVADGGYLTVPTSGNAFPRWMLDRVMPIPEEDFRHGAEAFLHLHAAFLGTVGVVDEPLSRYRVHGTNDFARAGTIDAEALRRRLEHAEILDRHLVDIARSYGYDVPPGRVSGSPDFRLMQLVLARLESGERPISDGLRLAARSPGARSMRARRRALMAVAGPAIALLPPVAVRHIRDVAFAGKPLLDLR